MKRKKKSLNKRLQYWFDLWMSKGSGSMILLLFAVTGLVIVLIGLLVWGAMRREGESFLHAVWNVLLHTLDPGVVSGDVSDSKWFLFLMLMATFVGVFYLALLIGFINDAIQVKMQNLAMGREAVIEEDHTVILGFNEAALLILEELIEGAEGHTLRDHSVVILDEMNKQEMEEKIRLRFPDTGNIRVVCRSGSTCSSRDLERCSILTCRSVIVCMERDFDTIKSILAVSHMLNTEEQAGDGFVTAVINSSRNELTARIAGYDADFLQEQGGAGGQDRLELLMIENTVSRIMAHTCRQIGLARVFNELFSFRDSECHIVRNQNPNKEFFRRMTGKTIREINRCLPSACAIGVIDRHGKVRISDPERVILKEGCSLILLAENDDEIQLIPEQTAVYTEPEMRWAPVPVSVLIIDVNSKLPFLLKELSRYLAPGSTIHLASDTTEVREVVTDDLLSELADAGIRTAVRDTYRIFDYPALRVLLDNCGAEHVIILSDQVLDDDTADEQALTLLLYIQQYRREHPDAVIGITCEMRSINSQSLAQQAVSSDFIISRNIAALMMAQISDNRELREVFDSLLDSQGYEIYMKDAGLYFLPEGEIDLYSAAEAVAAKGDILIGYKKKGASSIPVLNPRKSVDGKPVRLAFEQGDELIVLSMNVMVDSPLEERFEDADF